MTPAWIEWQDRDGRRRESLRAGLTVLGGGDADIPLEGAGEDVLHVWDDPPKVVTLGGDPPEISGLKATEASLSPGDVIHWKGFRLLYGEDRAAQPAAPPVIQEVPLPEPERTVGSGAEVSGSPEEQRAWSLLRAGLLVELGLADSAAARRWQAAVARGEFDVNLAAAELGRTELPVEARQRVADRSARLFRDLVMAPVQRGARGAGRKVRGAAKGGVAFVIAQAFTLVIYTVLIGVLALIARVRWGWGYDAFFDRVRDTLPG